MASIDVGRETLTYNNIWYVDGDNGNDTTGVGTEESPFKTVQRGVNASNSGDAVFIRVGNYVGIGGASVGFVDIVSKDIDIIGERDPNTGEVATIESTNRNTFRLSGSRVRIFNTVIRSMGTQATGGTVNYALMFYLLGTSDLEVFNSVLVPRGIIFTAGYGRPMKFENCVIDYSGHHFIAEINAYSTVSATFTNCIELGTYTSRTSTAYSPFLFFYSIYTGDKSFSVYDSTCIYEPDTSVNERYEVVVGDWKKTGKDGGSVGVYGGKYSWQGAAVIIIDPEDVDAHVPKNTDHVFDFTILEPAPSYTVEEYGMSKGQLGSGKVYSADLVLGEWKDITRLEVK